MKEQKRPQTLKQICVRTSPSNPIIASDALY